MNSLNQCHKLNLNLPRDGHLLGSIRKLKKTFFNTSKSIAHKLFELSLFQYTSAITFVSKFSEERGTKGLNTQH